MYINLIFLIVFNVLFFATGKAGHNVSVWISFGFINFAYLMLLLTSRLIRNGKSAAVFGFSLYSVSVAYFLVEFVSGIIFILVAPETYSIALLVQLCIAGLYAVGLISNMIANKHTANAEEKRQPEIEYIKHASAKLKGLLENTSDGEVKKAIERVYDAIYSSPVKSHPNVTQSESKILKSIDEFSNIVRVGNKENITTIANILLSTINERNNMLKASH
jgi:hypothetical protein